MHEKTDGPLQAQEQEGYAEHPAACKVVLQYAQQQLQIK